MPTSSREGKQKIVNWVKSLSDINAVLDIGAGKGTYVRLLKYKSKVLPLARFTCIEAWTPYIEKFDLSSKYDMVINEDARKVDYTKLGNIDLTIAGDVLEHMTKQESIDIVNQIASISKFMIISIPVIHYPQEIVNNNPFEEHIKDDWSHEEVMNTWSKFIIDSSVGNEIGVYLLRF